MKAKGGLCMPDVIDNAKVGEYIKTLLKERNMTQSDLARELNISKSAVSQNLNGKSTFDIQNLMHIAELFEVSLDLLLNMKSDEDRNIISEYERLVRRGYEAIAEAAIDKLNVAVPDLYGKVLVEYVMDYDKRDIFEHLVHHGIRLFEPHQSNAREVQLEIIAYMIDRGMNGFLPFLHNYVRQYGLERYEDSTAQRSLFATEVTQDVVVMKHFHRIKRFPILSDKDWSRLIGKYKAECLLRYHLEESDIVRHIEHTFHYFIQYGFFDGIEMILDYLSEDDVERIRSKPSMAQELIYLVSASKKDSLFETMVSKRLYHDATKLAIHLMDDKNENLTHHLIDEHADILDFRRIGAHAAARGDTTLLVRIHKQLKDDDLDYILSSTTADSLETNLVLLRLGARMNAKYLNKDTTEKINRLLTHQMDKGDQ
jgi:transcriptional regulator with XRE-family HTH domain